VCLLSAAVALTTLGPREARAQVPPERATPHAPEGRAGAPPFDPATVIARVRRSFHPDGDALVALGDAHALSSRDGRVTLRPRGAAPGRAHDRGVVFETRAVTRGATALLSRAVRTRVGDDGGLDLERAALREHWRNAARAVEQSWTFAERPAGRGDLTVRVSVRGARFTSAAGDGLQFDAAGTAVRYGVATWIDARGARATVRPTFERGDAVLVVPSDVLEHSAYPAVLDPTITAEFPIDATSARAPVVWTSGPSLAFDGTNYALAWIDNSGPDAASLRASPTTTPAVYATRIAPSGQILDPAGFVLAPPGASSSPHPHTAMAATAAGTLVVWDDSATGLYGRAFGPDGAVRGSAPVRLSSSCSGLPASVATDGTNFLVVWSQSGDVYARP
jgi:hypothetical protein